MSKNKMLPIGQPIISYEPVVNHITGIMNSNFEKYQSAFYNNFIDILIDNAADFDDIKNWLRYGMFEFYRIPKNIMYTMNENELINRLCEWIDEDFYVLISFETFFVSNYTTYKTRKFRHYAMIRGYDKDREIFSCGDFFDFNYYSIEDCSMKEVVQGILNNGTIGSKGFAKDFTLLRIDEQAIPKLDVNKVIFSLDKLLTEYNHQHKRSYGLALCDRICQMIKMGTFYLHENEFKRHAHFMIVHMDAMVLRIRYFESLWNDDLSDMIDLINKEKQVMELYRNYLLKLMAKGITTFPDDKKGYYIKTIGQVKNNYANIIEKLKKYLLSVK